MKRVQMDVPRSKKGRAHYAYIVEDKDIANAAGIRVASVTAARFRGELNTFPQILKMILRRRLTLLRN